MKRWMLIILLSLTAFSQVPVRPIVQPHMVFFDATGSACIGCSLFSFAAGTTTPQATYVDSAGSSQNPNPIVLGADGGPQTPSGSTGGIWLSSLAYKFVLKDALGNTIWTADNVTAAVWPCPTPTAINITNNAGTGLTCDPNITINVSAHTLNVGTLGSNYVQIGALGTSTRWNFDTTTPATALASLGGGVVNSGLVNQLAYYAAGGTAVSGTTAIPSIITAITRSPSDNSTFPATTAYVASPGAINPTSVRVAAGTAMTGNQGTGLLVQHSTGATVTGHGAVFDASGNVIDSGGTGVPFSTLTDVTGSFTFGTTYQNTGVLPLQISGYGTITGGSGDSMIMCNMGTASPSSTPWSTNTTATVSGEHVGFSCIIPPSYFYSVTVTNIISGTPGKWFNLQ